MRVPLVVAILFAATATAAAQDPPRSRGIRGALAEEPAVISSRDNLASATEYLRLRNAKRIEDLSGPDLFRTVHLPKDQAKLTWRARLSILAREELGRRGVTNDPFPSPPMPEPDAPRPAMTLSADGLEILARIVKGETWHDTPHEGEVAVASVVLNRVTKKGFPKTIAGVAHQPLQFSCYNEDVRDQLYWGPIRASALQAAKDAAAGQDPVNGATHYFNPYLVSPSWAKKLKFVKRIGDSPKNTHDFYR